jgi:hypothetical protein
VLPKEIKLTGNATNGTSTPAALAGSIRQTIEGSTVADLQWGTAGALPVTYSFWLKTSIAGTWGVFLQDTGNAVAYVSNCTTAAATWTFCTGVIPGDTAGTWANTPNTIGGIFGVTFAAGSTFQAAAAGAWSTGNYIATSAQTQLTNSVSATFEITQLKLERGSVPTPFQADPFAVGLLKAQHFYQSSFKIGTAVAQDAGTGTGESLNYQQIASADPSFFIPFNPPIYHVASPTVTTYSPAAATAQCYDETGAAALNATPNTTVTDTGIAINCNTTQATIAHVIGIHWTVDTGF